MSKRNRVPSYCLHRATGQAVVYLNRREIYLGAHGSPESRQKYAEVIAEWVASSNSTDRENQAASPPTLSTAELVARYLGFARTYYLDRRGKPSNHYERVHRSLGVVVDLHGETPAGKFTATALDRCRAEMIRRDWSRKHINACVSCIRRAWKWGVSRDLVRPEVYERLTCLEPLRAGKCKARETPPVTPVEPSAIDSILPYLGEVLADMVRVHYLTGMRAGELCQLHLSQIERVHPSLWLYRPTEHKSQHCGGHRIIAIGPQAIALIGRHITSTCSLCGSTGRRRRLGMREEGICGPCADRCQDAGVCGPWPAIDREDVPIFSPADALEDRYAALRATRRSKVQPSQQCRKRAKSQRKAGDRYTPNTYNQAIRRACDAAGIQRFHSHQIRHATADRLKDLFGLEIARAALGHSSLSTTLIYVDESVRKAADAIRRVG